MTPLRDDLLAALKEHGPMPTADAARNVGTTAQIALVALHAMAEAGAVRLTRSRRSRATGRFGTTFEAIA